MSIATTPPNEITLESVHKDFQVWRTNRASREKIPEHLWGKTKNLIGKHRISHISTRLGISFQQMKNAGILLETNEKKPFVNVELSSLLQTTTPKLQLLLENERGKRLTLNNLSDLQMAKVIEQFWG